MISTPSDQPSTAERRDIFNLYFSEPPMPYAVMRRIDQNEFPLSSTFPSMTDADGVQPQETPRNWPGWYRHLAMDADIFPCGLMIKVPTRTASAFKINLRIRCCIRIASFFQIMQRARARNRHCFPPASTSSCLHQVPPTCFALETFFKSPGRNTVLATFRFRPCSSPIRPLSNAGCENVPCLL